jgi:hypothetical protein
MPAHFQDARTLKVKLNTISCDLYQLTTTACPLSVPLSTVKTRNVHIFFNAFDFYSFGFANMTVIMAQDVQLVEKV